VLTTRFQRVLRLLMYLQSGPRFNAGELAHEFQVSRRTIFRDITVLREMGIPVHFDETSDAYRLAREYRFGRTPQLSPDELATLALAAHLSLTQLVPEMAAGVREATAKLLCAFPESTRTDIVNLLNTTEAEFPASESDVPSSAVLGTILESLRTRRQIRVAVAEARQSRPLETKVSPYRLVASARGWVLEGRSSVHQRTRTFEVSQIRRVEMTEDSYSIPHGFRHRARSVGRESKAQTREPSGS
jgi:predicted DNA-binding transcriptional regulator YafY